MQEGISPTPEPKEPKPGRILGILPRSEFTPLQKADWNKPLDPQILTIKTDDLPKPIGEDEFSFEDKTEEPTAQIPEPPVSLDDTANHAVVVEPTAAADSEPTAQAASAMDADEGRVLPTPSELADKAAAEAAAKKAAEEAATKAADLLAAANPGFGQGRTVGAAVPILGKALGDSQPLETPEQKAQRQAAQKAANNAKWESRRNTKSLGGLFWNLVERYQKYSAKNQEKFGNNPQKPTDPK